MSDIRIKMAKDLRDMSDMVGDLHWMAAKAVEDLIKKDARIAELEHRCGVYGLELHNATERLQQAERQIKAIKAQEPVEFAFRYDDGSWHDVSATQHSTGMVSLYAAPVSEPKAQGVVMPAAHTPEQSKGRPFSAGWNACLNEVARLNADPVQQEQSFCEYCGGNDENPQDHCMDCTRPLQQVSVPDGWKLAPVEPTHEMLGAALMNQVECLDAIEVIRTDYKAMLAAAPAPGGE